MFRSFRFGRNIVCVYIYIQIVGSNKNNKKKRVELYFERYLLVSRMEKKKIELLGVGGERKNNNGERKYFV